MKRLLALIFVLGLVASILTYNANAKVTAAAFNQNHIIDDAVFNNTATMNAGQIDAFLNQFPSSCISTNSGFAALDPTGYQPSPSAFLYSNSPVSAGTVIYDAAQAYGLNPQVLIATLQKEEGLVDGSGPYGCGATAMASAAGYGCTDSGTNTHNYTYPGGGLVTPLYYRNGTAFNSIAGSCVNSGAKAGFSEQIIHATWLLKFSEERSKGNINWAVIKGNWDNSDDPQSCYTGYMTQGTWQRCPSGGSSYYDGWVTIDSTAVHMDTGATASLYVYTPHFHGNQNFFNIFTGWFGDTTVAGYMWTTTGYVITSPDGLTAYDASQLQPGQLYRATLEAMNVGTSTWLNNGPHPVTLGTINPSSQFCRSTWVACNRPAYLQESSVAPGQEGHFVFQFQAPFQVGTYTEQLKPVAEMLTWFNDTAGQNFIITVRSPGTFNWTSGGYHFMDSTKTNDVDPNLLAPGEQYTVILTAHNTGTATWTNNGPTPTNLATANPTTRSSGLCDSLWLTCWRPGTLEEASVAPGQDGHFTFHIRVPFVVGSYHEDFKPVAEMFTWFNDTSNETLSFTVSSPGTFSWTSGGYQIMDLTKSTTIDPSQLAPGQRYVAILTAHNAGTATWSNHSSTPANLATANPTTRSSILCDATWFTCWRPGTLDESSVAPGQDGHFSFVFKAPFAAGSYHEDFKPVAEMFTWFNDTSNETLSFTVSSPGTFSWTTTGFTLYDQTGTNAVDPSQLQTNQTYLAVLNAINTGSATWYNNSPIPVTLAASNPTSRTSSLCLASWVACNRPAYLQEASTTPGQTGHFRFLFKTPANPGSYSESFKPVAEMFTWFNDTSNETLSFTVH